MIEITSGITGQGKSLYLAKKALELLERNKTWSKKGYASRKVASNLTLNAEITSEYKDFIHYWTDPIQLVTMHDVDILWDEIATHLDSQQWQNLPLEIKIFLRQHRKRGIDIYGTTQRFKDVDNTMRSLVDDLYVATKIIGSGNPSTTKPPVKRVWGFSLLRQVDKKSFDSDELKTTGVFDWLIIYISKKLVSTFDTRQDIKMGQYPPLKHIERNCVDPDCKFHRVVHV